MVEPLPSGHYSIKDPEDTFLLHVSLSDDWRALRSVRPQLKRVGLNRLEEEQRRRPRTLREGLQAWSRPIAPPPPPEAAVWDAPTWVEVEEVQAPAPAPAAPAAPAPSPTPDPEPAPPELDD